MDNNKKLFKAIISSTILRKHRDKMSDIEHFHRKRSVGIEKIPVEEYGVKWGSGNITLRRYLNDTNTEVFIRIGQFMGSIELNYYDILCDDFITPNKDLIKEMIKDVELRWLTDANTNYNN